MENIFFVVLVAVVALVRWLSQVAENKKNAEAERQAGSPPAGGAPTTFQRPPAQTEEERIRRFMEALGVPTSSPPPPPVQPRPTEPKTAQPKRAPSDRKFLPVDPFPVPRPHLPEQRPPVVVATPPPAPAAPPPVPVPPATPLPTRETTVLTRPLRQPAITSAIASEFEVQDLDAVTADDMQSGGRQVAPRYGVEATTQKTSLAARLANAQSLRDAIVLREIFGPPRSMQPTEPVR